MAHQEDTTDVETVRSAGYLAGLEVELAAAKQRGTDPQRIADVQAEIKRVTGESKKTERAVSSPATETRAK